MGRASWWSIRRWSSWWSDHGRARMVKKRRWTRQLYFDPKWLLGSKSVTTKSTSEKTSEKIFSSLKKTNLIIEHGFSSTVHRAGPVQFGERPSWTQHGFSSIIGRTWPVQFRELPSLTQHGYSSAVRQSSSANGRAGSTGIRLHLVLVTPLPILQKTHSCYVSIEGIVGTLRFKNRKNPFFLEEHSDWSYKMETVSRTPKVAYTIRGIWMFSGIDVVSEAFLL